MPSTVTVPCVMDCWGWTDDFPAAAPESDGFVWAADTEGERKAQAATSAASVAKRLIVTSPVLDELDR